MSRTTLDCMGLPCPQPVLRTKEAIEQGAQNLEVWVDNEASKNNVIRFATSQGHQAQIVAAQADRFQIAIAVTPTTGQASTSFDPQEYACPLPGQLHTIYVISSDSMGRGSDELGWALLQTYIQTIKDVSPLPQKIIFYNAGVKLVTQESGALEALKALQERGVEIFACGTCLDFFQLKSAIKVGEISNMYDIMRSMSEADKVLSPQ